MMSFSQPRNFTITIQKLLTAGFTASFGLSSNPVSRLSPQVNVLNGRCIGVCNEFYNQDLFLGIPYAQAPVGDLRFRAPVSPNKAWNGTKEAVKYSDVVSQKHQLHGDIADYTQCVSYRVSDLKVVENRVLTIESRI
jgi:hypothetical protein